MAVVTRHSCISLHHLHRTRHGHAGHEHAHVIHPQVPSMDDGGVSAGTFHLPSSRACLEMEKDWNVERTFRLTRNSDPMENHPNRSSSIPVKIAAVGNEK